jgi:EAL domain-containing protein (putative c-di-GMP-specific phosphodiesterase class I)
VDSLRIDCSFVSGTAGGENGSSLVPTIIQLGRLLKVSTFAEGIEKQEQLDLLIAEGCTCGQGTFLSPPMPVEEIDDVLLELETGMSRWPSPGRART